MSFPIPGCYRLEITEGRRLLEGSQDIHQPHMAEATTFLMGKHSGAWIISAARSREQSEQGQGAGGMTLLTERDTSVPLTGRSS